MSIQQLKQEIESLSRDQRHLLSSYLTELELKEDQDYWTVVRQRAGDSDKSHWLSADELVSD